MKYLLFVVFYFFINLGFGQSPAPKNNSAVIICPIVEQPRFPGGVPAMYKWIGKNLIYPPNAKKNRIQGKLFVRFTITEDGTVIDPVILKGQNIDYFEKEVYRLVRAFPKWTPATRNGVAVSTYFTMPIAFKLYPNKKPRRFLKSARSNCKI